MSTVQVAPAQAGATTPRDVRRFTRWTAALLMPIGPAVVALIRFFLPYDTPDTAATQVAKIAAHPEVTGRLAWTFVLAIFTLVPGAYAALRLSRRSAPRLTVAAAGLLVPGYLALVAGGAGSGDMLMWVGTTHGADHAILAHLVELLEGSGPGNLLGVVFVIGHILGTVLLGIALWRAGAVPGWAAAVLAVSQPIHLVAALTGNHPLDLIGWGMTAIGMGIAAVAVLRTADDDWDLAPRAASQRAAARPGHLDDPPR